MANPKNSAVDSGDVLLASPADSRTINRAGSGLARQDSDSGYGNSQLTACSLRWDSTPLALREDGVTRIAVADDKTVWVGTTNGLAFFDGDEVGYPKFMEPKDRTVLIVRDLLPLEDGGVLVGTIKGSIWYSTKNAIQKIVDIDDRSENSFGRFEDGTVLIANSFGRLTADHLSRI